MDQPIIHNLLAAAAMCLMVPLSGCGSNSNWPVAGSVLRNAVFGEPDSPISRESVSKLPYAMITARVSSRSPAILVLASSEGGTRQWMATNEISIVTHNGRIVQTVGFPQDIRHTELFGADPLSNAPHLLQNSVAYQRISYFRNGDHGSDISLSLNCTMKPVKPVELEIVEILLQTILMEENCRPAPGQESNKKQTNFFWVDPYDGFTWQSRQTIVNGYPPVTVMVLKPEG